MLNLIQNRVDLAKLLLNELHHYTLNPMMRPLVRYYLQKNWGAIEQYLTNGRLFISEILRRRPDLKDILLSKQGIAYLNWVLPRTYKMLRRVAFDPDYPDVLDRMVKEWR